MALFSKRHRDWCTWGHYSISTNPIPLAGLPPTQPEQDGLLGVSVADGKLLIAEFFDRVLSAVLTWVAKLIVSRLDHQTVQFP